MFQIKIILISINMQKQNNEEGNSLYLLGLWVGLLNKGLA
jgi:hypothetical protein